ncbi:MAG: hypothetical protein ABIP20_18490 [Chthoniobacteraceae bacterium]
MRTIHWLILTGCSFVAGCNRSSGTVVFVAPDKFTGLFLVVEDRRADRTVKKDRGDYVFSVPKDGKIIVRDASVLSESHKLSVQYENGYVLEFGAIDPRSGHSVWPLANVDGFKYFYFVGSLNDCEEVRKQGDLTRLPLGVPIDDVVLRNSRK